LLEACDNIVAASSSWETATPACDACPLASLREALRASLHCGQVQSQVSTGG